MIEIRWHGRGGQGVVTASYLLARAVLSEGKYAQHFPEFGPERRGAPVVSYTRIDEEPIEIHSGIYEPDIVVVIDPTLLFNVETVLRGLKKGGSIVVNSPSPKQELMDEAGRREAKVYYVDAYRIAMDVFKRALYNTPMLGALIKASGLVKLDSALKAVRERFGGEVAERNVEAIKRAFEEVKLA
ncbi:MAG: hypothetical protein B6U69_00205 [Thermofilum sp. ex4484_15]|nr:MAG: hypothetical protein B6U69_00205 [Thermofilum sp. ex4484_15]